MRKFKKHLSAPNISELLVMGGVSAKEQIDSLYAGVSEAAEIKALKAMFQCFHVLLSRPFRSTS